MLNNQSITQKEILLFTEGRHAFYGARQNWYPKVWQQQSGCGPTTCSHLVWYFAKSRKHGEALCPYQGNSKESIKRLMEDIWEYVTPTMLGVHSIDIFADGISRYGQEKNVPLTVHRLNVPPQPGRQPSYEAVKKFIHTAFEADMPVAFLNRSSGKLTNLSGWHWVTLVGWEQDGVRIYDQGVSWVIDLELWLSSHRLGGGFVWFEDFT